MTRSLAGVMVFLLAMVLQTVAPTSATLARTAAQNRAVFQICSGAGNETLDRQRPANERRHHQLCIACVACCGDGAVAPSAVVALRAQDAGSHLAWRAHATEFFGARRESGRQARAPPSFSS